MLRMMFLRKTFLLFALLPAIALAHDSYVIDMLLEGDEIDILDHKWHLAGETELGFIANTGNTENIELNGVVNPILYHDRWSHNLRFEAQFSEGPDGRTAERYMVEEETRYLMSRRDLLFGTIRYDANQFGPFRYVVTEAVGYGRYFFHSDEHRLLFQLGPGGRHQKERGENGETTNELISYFGATYDWFVTDLFSFAQSVHVEIPITDDDGRYNVYTRAISSIRSTLIGRLGVRISFTLENNSNVNPGNENTDTITSVTLSYAF